MAQNITLLGASYSDVPAVQLPKTGGGTARFDDVSVTTATASDVASGKVFVAANGTITTGTASGGGASNFVTGTFVADSGTGAAHSITIPYTGSGYPIMAVVVVEQGMYNSAIGDWYSTIQRYAIGEWTMTKAVFTSAPSYSTSGTQNYGVVASLYKTNTSSATSYTAARSTTANIFSSSNASASNSTCVRFRNAKTLSYFTASTSYGLMAGIEYRYYIIYSS